MDILIVGARKSWKLIYEETFNSFGYKYEFVSNIEFAISKLSAIDCKVVLIDWDFGSIEHGIGLLENIQNNFPEIPILLLINSFSIPGSIERVKDQANSIQARIQKIKLVIIKDDPITKDPISIILEFLVNTIGPPKSMAISWLHLSDLHLGKQPYLQDKVLKHLIIDIEKMNQNFDLIFFTGDITHSGQAEQFQHAKTFFDKLLDITGLPKSRLFLVPGNHDVNWNELDKYINAGVSQVLDSPDKIIEFMVEGDSKTIESRRAVFQRLSNYSKFINSYFVEKDGSQLLSFNERDYYYVKSINIKSSNIVIIGLNSAWASSLHFDFKNRIADDLGNLILGEPQIDDALEKAQDKNGDLVITLMHHQFNWFKSFDKNLVEFPIRKVSHFILHGHIHEANYVHQFAPGIDSLAIGAGTSYEKRDENNGYCYVKLDLATGKGKLVMRRYTANKGGAWVPDNVSYPDSQNGEIEFDIPK